MPDANANGSEDYADYLAADEMTKMRAAINLVVTTFEKDESQGYRSKDRQFAIDVLKAALSH